jgi:hypothetical protein
MLVRWTDRLDLAPKTITASGLTVDLDEQGYVLAELDLARTERLLGTGQFAVCEGSLDEARAQAALEVARTRPKPAELTVEGCVRFLTEAAAKDPAVQLLLAGVFGQAPQLAYAAGPEEEIGDEPDEPPAAQRDETRFAAVDPVPLILPEDEDDFGDLDSSPESLGQSPQEAQQGLQNALQPAPEASSEVSSPPVADVAAERLAEAFSLRQQYLSDRKGLQKILKSKGTAYSPRDSVTTLISKLLGLPEGWAQQE